MRLLGRGCLGTGVIDGGIHSYVCSSFPVYLCTHTCGDSDPVLDIRLSDASIDHHYPRLPATPGISSQAPIESEFDGQ